MRVKPSKLPIVVSVMCGLLVGIFLHFVLFRSGLPVRPFIYQAF